jgi:hypothetical protein
METGKGKKRLESSWAITLLAQIVLVGPGEKSTAANGWLSVRFFFLRKALGSVRLQRSHELPYRMLLLGMAMGQVRIRYNNYSPVSKEDMSRNSYLYPYPRVKIYTRTCTRRVSVGYRVPVGFTIPHVKIISK